MRKTQMYLLGIVLVSVETWATIAVLKMLIVRMRRQFCFSLERKQWHIRQTNKRNCLIQFNPLRIVV